MRKLTIEELGCKDLKYFSYTYDDIGYCSIGEDYNAKKPHRGMVRLLENIIGI